MERAADLQSQVAVMQEKIQALLRGVGSLQVILPELHDETSGRIDAQKLATFMGVPLKRLAEGLQLNYKGLHRNPSSEGFQPALKTVKRSVEILHNFFHKPETVRVWLNTSHPDLRDGGTFQRRFRNPPRPVRAPGLQHAGADQHSVAGQIFLPVGQRSPTRRSPASGAFGEIAVPSESFYLLSRPTSALPR